MHGFNTTGEGLWQALVQCFRTSSTGIPPVISKAQSALEGDVTAAAALRTGRGKMVMLMHTFKSLSFLSKSQGGRRENNVLYDTERLLLLEKCVTKSLKLSSRGVMQCLTPKMCTLHSSCPGKIIYQHYLSALCWPGVRVAAALHR